MNAPRPVAIGHVYGADDFLVKRQLAEVTRYVVAEGLALAQGEAHPVHSLHHAPAGEAVRVEVLDLEDDLADGPRHYFAGFTRWKCVERPAARPG